MAGEARAGVAGESRQRVGVEDERRGGAASAAATSRALAARRCRAPGRAATAVRRSSARRSARSSAPSHAAQHDGGEVGGVDGERVGWAREGDEAGAGAEGGAGGQAGGAGAVTRPPETTRAWPRRNLWRLGRGGRQSCLPEGGAVLEGLRARWRRGRVPGMPMSARRDRAAEGAAGVEQVAGLLAEEGDGGGGADRDAERLRRCRRRRRSARRPRGPARAGVHRVDEGGGAGRRPGGRARRRTARR